MAQVSITLNFQSAAGNPLAGGRVQIRLTQDASLGVPGGPSVSCLRTTILTLSGTGSVTFSIWPNDVFLPTGSAYFVTAYSAAGQVSWVGQMTVDSLGNIVWLET
jgi:hypothetical protein